MSASLPASSNAGSPGPAHPAWCSPRHCTAGDGHDDVHHMSTPIAWHALRDDAELSLARYRPDDGGEPGETGWLLRIRHEGVASETSAYVTDFDLDQIAVARMQHRLDITSG